MPAGVTTLRLDNNLGSFREWVATADVGSGDYAAGATVNVTVTMTSGGVPPGSDETFQLIVKNSAGTTVRTITLTANTASQSTSFVLTANGSAGGGDRCGVFEMVLRAARTTVVAYDVSSDQSTTTEPAGFVDEHIRGWVRGTTTCTLSLSNVSAGGAKTTPAAFNESIFVRAVLAHQSIVAYTLTLGVTDSLGGPAQTGASNSTTSATRDTTLTGIVDNRFTAASRTFTSTITVPNDSLSGAAWTTLGTPTTDTIDADPRLTITHHLQVNNNTYSAALDRSSRLTSDLGFVTFKITDARAQAVSGITCNPHSLRDSNNLSAAQFSVSEATDATGRPASMQTWDAALPGGAWTHTTTISAPSDATGLGSPGTASLTLLAASPSLRVIVGCGPPISNRARHMTDQETSFVTFVGAVDVDLLTTLSSTTTPAITEAKLALIRVNASVVAQYLNASGVWTNITAGTAIDFHAATETGSGTGVFTKSFTTDSTWGTHDIAVVGRVVVGGTPYGGVDKEIVVGASNLHDGYALDPMSFAGVNFR